MATVAINGLGRIGRATLKVLLANDTVHVAAVDDLVPIDNLACPLRYVSVSGHDNDWGFTHRMVRGALAVLGLETRTDATVGGGSR